MGCLLYPAQLFCESANSDSRFTVIEQCPTSPKQRFRIRDNIPQRVLRPYCRCSYTSLSDCLSQRVILMLIAVAGAQCALGAFAFVTVEDRVAIITLNSQLAERCSGHHSFLP